MIPIPAIPATVISDCETRQEKATAEVCIALWAIVERLDALRYVLEDK